MLVHIHTADLIEEGQGIGVDTPALPPPVIAYWEYWAGEEAKWQPLKVVTDATASLTRSGNVFFEAPVDIQKTKVGLLRREDDPSLFWIRYRIEQELGAGYEIAPRIEDVLLNTISAINAVTVPNELLGASSGLPNQEFDLANRQFFRKR